MVQLPLLLLPQTPLQLECLGEESGLEVGGGGGVGVAGSTIGKSGGGFWVSTVLLVTTATWGFGSVEFLSFSWLSWKVGNLLKQSATTFSFPFTCSTVQSISPWKFCWKIAALLLGSIWLNKWTDAMWSV